MPSPSKFSLICGLVATGGFMYGGAWLASGMTSTDAPQDAGDTTREMPILAPLPGLVTEPIEEIEPTMGGSQSSVGATHKAPDAEKEAGTHSPN